MINKACSWLSTIFLCVIFLLSCSEGNPISQSIFSPAVPDITNADAAPAESAGHALWGYYLVSINQKDYSAEIIPIRATAGHWNVLQFLEQAPCSDCFKLAGISPNPDGTLNVNVRIKHPFTNLDLTGFDVRGIAMFNGSHNFPESGLVMSDRTLGEGEVVNAGGYTTLYNPTTVDHGFTGYIMGKLATASAPSSTLNAFKRFVTDDPANTRNAFYAGDEIVVTYQIDMPNPPKPWVFGYAVDACWALPISKPVEDPMTDFGPEANCPEAWKFEVTDTPVGDGLTDCGGQAKLTIEVYDWQGKDDAHPVIVECPELFDGEVEATWKADAVGFTTYEAVIENAKNAPVGFYKCLVSKEAQENDPVKPWLDITAYRLHEVEVVVATMMPPTAVAEAIQPSAYVDENIFFDAGGSHDNDCGNQSIVTYEWDWENDGEYDETGSQVYHSWTIEGTYQIQLRVTDDESQTDTLDAPLEIFISNVKVPPVAIATADPPIQLDNLPIHFSDDGSYDPDGGSIVTYEWDWDNDGTYDEEGAKVDHTWSTPGTYQVQFRVTDDEAVTDTLDAPLEITINSLPVALATADHLIREAEQPIHFSDDGSYDPDGGLIFAYEWDWENDGTYDQQGAQVDHTWTTAGTYYVQFRVTDNEGQTDTLDEPLEIVILPKAVSLNWAKRAGGTSDNEEGAGITNLSDDSTVVTGSFVGSATFGEGDPNETVLTASGGSDIFVARYNPDGTLAWAKRAGGTSFENGKGITARPDNSTVVTGKFQGSVTFGPGEANQKVLNSAGSDDIFVARYNADGTLAWAKRAGAGGMNSDGGMGITALSDNSTVVTGSFSGSATFGPGESNQKVLSSAGGSDMFVARYNADGTLAWAKRAGGSSSDFANGITTLTDNSTAVTGYFNGSATFGSGETNKTDLTSYGSADIFIAHYNTDGTLAWAKSAGGADYDIGNGVTALSDNSTVVTGYFSESATFGPGELNETVLISAESWDIFIACYNPDGTLDWAKSAPGDSGSDKGFGITTLSDDTTVVTGSFRGSATFGPGEPNQTILSAASPSNYDIFIARYNPDGTLDWAKSVEGEFNFDEGYGITTLSDDSTAVTGKFGGVAVFGPGELNETVLTSAGGFDIFIARFNPL